MIKKAVIPVAGYGTRFLPFTKSVPKEMLPIVDRPVIQYIVEEAIASGIQEIILVTGSNKRAIEDYFDYNLELEQQLKKAGKDRELALVREVSDSVSFAYVRQKEALGLGHAILTARHLVNGEPFAIMYGDDVFLGSDKPVLQSMIELFNRFQTPIASVVEVEPDQVSKYGIIKGENLGDNIHTIESIVEKPDPAAAPSRLASIGRWILPPTIFDILEQTPPGKGGEIQITDAIDTLLKQSGGHAFEYSGRYYDCGNKLDYVKAVIDTALSRDDIGEKLREHLNATLR